MSTRENVLFNIMPDITSKINDDGVAFSLQSRDYKDAQSVYALNDQGGSHMSITKDSISTLRAEEHGHQPIIADEAVALNAYNGTGGNNMPMIMEDNNMEIQNNTIVRRLTPLECTRLQGFPDSWVDIGEWTDTKGKKHKDADAQKYKALGNSIALPFWEWMAERMVNVLKADGVENPTMASLFDGIGGFPLTYKRCGCEPVWSSEIEDFPIAVCKRHFGDEDTGEVGDIKKFL